MTADGTGMAKQKREKTIATLKHDEASRKNIPTAEFRSVMDRSEQSPIRVAYERRNRDLDPQLVWRGKDQQDWSDLVVQAPPLYIQEKVHPKVLIDDLRRRTGRGAGTGRTMRPRPSPTSSPTSTACPTRARRPSSTSTTPTGRTG